MASIDISRTWWAVNRLIDDDEKGHCISAAGVLLRPGGSVGDLKRGIGSEVRDVVVFANTRVVVVFPKPPRKMTLLGAVKGALGNAGAFGKVMDFRRSELTGFAVMSTPPDIPEFRDLTTRDTWLTLRFGDDELIFWRDERHDPKPQLDDDLRSYMDGATL